MARPIWKGSLSFGLVTIPVTLYPAENQAEELHFTMLDSRNGARIRYQRVSEFTGEEVPWDQIVKGYEYEDGNYVLLGDEDFKRAAVESNQTIAIEDFVPRDAVDHVYFDKPYYLLPSKGGEKAYLLLREVLAKTGKIGIATVVIRTRQHLAAVVPEGQSLVLDLLRYDYELRKPDDIGLPDAISSAGKPKPQELAMAEQLVEAMTTKWNPRKYHDHYRDKLVEWIKKKIKAGQLTPAVPLSGEEEDLPPAPINIMDLLKKSVESKGPARHVTSNSTAGRAAEGRTKRPRSAAKPKHAAPHAPRQKAG